MKPKEYVMKVGEQMRKVERENAKLHKLLERGAKEHAGLLGLNESEGDFTAMSGGTPKIPPSNP